MGQEEEMEKGQRMVNGGGRGKEEEEEEEEEEELGMAVLDFDMLCSTVALQTERGKWTKLHQTDGEDDDDFDRRGEYGAAFRMWEGELLDCFDDRRVAIESLCCPCYRFGKNMRRAGFGSCFLQGTMYCILALISLLSFIAFAATKQYCFLYLALAFIVSVGMYLGFFRTQIRKKFNIRGSDNSLDDCVYHLFCPFCTLCQESRTLEMNNVQDGTWHGRGDTILIGSYGEGNKLLFDLEAPPVVSTKFPETFSMQKNADLDGNSRSC